MFQYNALQTIIQLQSLILYIQTSWFTYTVLLLSLKFNKTKHEIIVMVQFLFSERAKGGWGVWLHKACFMRWAIMNITIWLLKMACFLLHTSHIISNIYNSANFPDRSKHLQTIGKTTSAHFWKLYGGERRWRRTTVWVDADIENLHARVFNCVYPSGRHVWGVASTLLTALCEWRKSTVAQWLKWKTKKREKRREDEPALYPTWLHWT